MTRTASTRRTFALLRNSWDGRIRTYRWDSEKSQHSLGGHEPDSNRHRRSQNNWIQTKIGSPFETSDESNKVQRKQFYPNW